MFDFINQALSEQGVNPLKKRAYKEKNITVKESSVSGPTKLKESDISYSELETLVEGAIKETSNNIIMSSMVLEDSQKLEQTNAINRTKINEHFTEKFLNETIAPVIEICGTLTEDARLLHTVSDPSKVRGVSLPVYEVALTIDSARRGALTEDSLDYTKSVKEDVDPTILDLRAASEEESAKDGKVDEDEQKLSDLVDDDVETYDMGEGVTEGCDPHNVHQYEDNDDLMYELDKGKEPENDLFEDDPDFEDEGDIEEYEGEPAGDPEGDEDSLPDEVMPMTEGQILARYMFGEDTDVDVEPEFEDEEDVEEYEGEPAGEGDELEGDDFEGDGTSDEAIIGEQQTLMAKKILGQIFHEYGITSKVKRSAIVREAIHYIFRYGTSNLFPVASDVSNLVVEQNNISEIDGHLSALTIVESTKPVLTEAQEQMLREKSLEYLYALSESDEQAEEAVEEEDETDAEDKDEKEVVKENSVMKAINFITKTSLIERTRQAFRCRMHFFSEEVKNSIANNWVLVENNTSEIAEKLKDDITIRSFVTETAEMKQLFSLLKEDSPVYKPCWKKAFINNDSLTTACLFTEVVAQWAKIKDVMYNGTSLTEKYIALDAMFHLHNIYENLCTGMADSSKAKKMINNHSFRLQNLKEKVELALSKQN